MSEIDSFQLILGGWSELGMAIAIGMAMFSVALGLKVQHFSFIKDSPKVFIAGVCGQIVILPLLTLGLCHLLSPLPSIALGMILIACCPGGNVSNMLVLLARGNTALSVSLTATSSFAAAFITPISIIFWSSLYLPTANLLTEIEFDASNFLIQTTIILFLPLSLGMLCAHKYPNFALRVRRPLVILSSIILFAIIVFAFVKYLEVLLTLGISLIGIVAIHNAAAFFSGNMVARLVGADKASRRAITFEVGIQNAGLGIVILLTQLSGLGGAAAITGLWGTWHILAGIMLVMIFRSIDRLSARTAQS